MRESEPEEAEELVESEDMNCGSVSFSVVDAMALLPGVSEDISASSRSNRCTISLNEGEDEDLYSSIPQLDGGWQDGPLQ